MTDDAAVRSRVWRAGALEAEDFPFEKISNYLDEEGCLVWVDIRDPDSHVLKELAAELTLDPLAVEDAVSHGERAKATRYSTHTFLTAYAAHIVTDDDTPAHRSELSLSRVSAFVLPRGIVTVRQDDSFDMDAVAQRWEDNADLLQYGVGALVHGLLDVIVDSHFEAVQALETAGVPRDDISLVSNDADSRYAGAGTGTSATGTSATGMTSGDPEQGAATGAGTGGGAAISIASRSIPAAQPTAGVCGPPSCSISPS